MAELVEQNLEQMLPELEQMQRVQLASKEEVKAIVKRRRRFEYQLQKQTKIKEDFLSYIQYELALMALIEMRREKLQYHHKRDEIDLSIARRVSKLYKILEHRFQTDIKVWLSHVEFLKKMKWHDAVGKVYRRMLQVHVHNEDLWVAAAKYEMEEAANAEAARSILLEALRFHKESKYLYKEYFRLELMYVEQLRKRSQVLAGTQEVLAENLDAVLEGQVVLAVLKKVPHVVSALKSVSGSCSQSEMAGFLCALFDIALKFDFATAVRQEIEHVLENDHKECAITWDTLARAALFSSASSKEGFETCQTVYKQGMAAIPSESERKALTDYHLQTLFELGVLPNITNDTCATLVEAAIGALEEGEKSGLLNEEHYTDWAFLLEKEGGEKKKASR